MSDPLQTVVLGLARTTTGTDSLDLDSPLTGDAAAGVAEAVRAVLAPGLDTGRAAGCATVGDLVALVGADRGTADTGVRAGAAEFTDGTAEASAGQAGIWLADQYDPASTAYNGPFFVRVPAALDPDDVREAVRRVVLRHDVLRTTLAMVDGTLRQRVDPEPRFGFAVREYRGDDELAALAHEVATVRFDLEHGPVATVVCARGLDRDETALLCDIHHVASDAASAGIFLTEVFDRLDEVTAGAGSPDRADRPQYADFVAWQRAKLAGDALPGLLDHWSDKLADAPPPPRLATDHPRSGASDKPGGMLAFNLPAEELAALDALGEREGVTLFTTALAAYLVLVAAHTGADDDTRGDLVVGSPVSLRDPPETQDMIGYFVNMVVLRGRVDRGSTVRELLLAVRAEVGDALRHKWAPFEKLLERLGPRRSGGDAPLVTTMLVMTPRDSGTVDWHGTPLRVGRDLDHGAKYDLSLILEPGRDGLHGSFEYDADLFHPDTVRAMGARYRGLLAQIAARPDAFVGDLLVPTDDERALLLAEGDRRPAAAPAVPVTELVEARVAAATDDVAVEFRGEAVTYGALNAAANRVGRALRGRGIGAGDRVGLCLPRSAEAVTALLGVLKSGGAYVPIDPEYPAERVTDMLTDAEVRLLLTDSATLAGLGGSADRTPALCLDTDGAEIAEQSGEDIGVVRSPDDPTYVVYTSGSSGRPKGVVITDRTVANLVRVQDRLSPIGARAKTLQYMSLSFDVSVMEVLGTLCAGGTLTVVPENLRTDLHALAEFVRDHDVARLYLPYIALQRLASIAVSAGIRMGGLREVASVGEQLVVSAQIREFFTAHPGARLLNMYGPSETHLATSYALTGSPGQWPDAPPIGRGVDGLRLLVLDRAAALVPPGVPGELHIGGPLISPGYHQRPGETAARFVPDPHGGPDDVLYRTGDLVRRDRDGELEYLGRADDQLKVRGFRIEPAEVEAAVAAVPGVRAAAVAAVSVGSGERRLAAFVVGCPEDPGEVRRAVARVLPDHMVPAHVVAVDALPSAPSGKIDRKALPGLFTPDGTESAGTPPRTPLERAIAAHWAELLGVASVNRDEDFFGLGGHSLLATELVYRLRAEHGVDLPLRTLLDTPTVAGMAERLDAAVRGDTAPARPELDLPADAVLAPEVRASGPAPVATAAARHVLLTGGTGFLGAFLLRELVLRTDATVHALVRAEDADAGRAKLAAAAESYGLPAPGADRVVVVPGDLAAERFGLDEPDYAALRDTVEAVYHAAAHINFVVPYASVKATNVDGMARVIGFAADGRVKPLHYTSTVAVFSPDEPLDTITEDDLPTEHRGLGIGYTQSKWVAEHLAAAGRDRGVPTSVYRIGRISGAADTGACQRADFLWRQVKSIIEVGTAPPGESMRTDLLPVDFVARAVVALSREPDSAGRTWHLHHPTGADFDTVYAGIRSLGFPVEVEPADDWLARVERAAAEPGGSALAAAVPLFREGALELGSNTYRNEATAAALARVGLGFPDIEPGAIARMIRFFQRTGELGRTPHPVG